MSGPATVGWCPGALRPMASGDGLILRVKPRGGRLSLNQAGAVADLSLRHGNGHLDLTGRANLQIRGARPETLDALHAGLGDADLLDTSAATEAVRNVVTSPLAGVDETAFDTRSFMAELEYHLATESRLQGLPPKWSFNVDGGGRVPLAGVAADVQFRFDRAGMVQVGLDMSWSAPLANGLDLPALLSDIVTLVAAEPVPCRMKDLLKKRGARDVFSHLRLEPAAPSAGAPPPIVAADLLRLTGSVVAFAPPFGTFLAATLRDAVAACRSRGADDLRLTPWRVVLVTGVTERASLLRDFARLGLIVDPENPRLRITACVGAPACHRALASTWRDAALLADRLGRDLDGTLHVAGCAKGCGRPAGSRWTLMARDQAYDVFSAVEPTLPCVTGLSSTEAANWLSRAGRPRIS